MEGNYGLKGWPWMDEPHEQFYEMNGLQAEAHATLAPGWKGDRVNTLMKWLTCYCDLLFSYFIYCCCFHIAFHMVVLSYGLYTDYGLVNLLC